MNIYETLSAVQREIVVPKKTFNKFGGFYSRSAEDIMEAAKPVCAKHEATFFLNDYIEVIQDRFYVKSTVTFVCKDEKIEVSAFAREQEHKTKMDEAQVTGAASSYARKYALCGLFGIDGQDDADTIDNREPKKRQQKQTQNNQLAAAKKRLSNAINRYCELAGRDPKEVKNKVPKIDGYKADDVDFFNKIAANYEKCNKQLEGGK